MRSIRLWIFFLICLLAVVIAVIFWQYQAALTRAQHDFFSQQLWLARQSAYFMEQQRETEMGWEKAFAHLTSAATGVPLGDHHAALFDLEAARFTQQTDDGKAVVTALAEDSNLLQLLQRGGHGSAIVSTADVSLLVTYLPLSREKTLVLTAQQSVALAAVQTLGNSLWVLVLLIPPAIFFFRFKEKLSRDNNLLTEHEDAAAGEAIVELQDQNRLLEQENALLTAARREYQLLVEGTDLGLARLNSSGQILFSSRPLLDLLGSERKDLTGRNLLDLEFFPEQTKDALSCAVEKIRSGSSAPAVKTLLQSGARTSEPFEIFFSPLRVDGTTTGMIMWMRSLQ